jgi:hypothetical protein
MVSSQPKIELSLMSRGQTTRTVKYNTVDAKFPFFSSCAYHEQTQTMIIGYGGRVVQYDSSGTNRNIGVQSPGEPNMGLVPPESVKGGWYPGDIIVGHPDPNNNKFLTKLHWY